MPLSTKEGRSWTPTLRQGLLFLSTCKVMSAVFLRSIGLKICLYGTRGVTKPYLVFPECMPYIFIGYSYIWAKGRSLNLKTYNNSYGNTNAYTG